MDLMLQVRVQINNLGGLVILLLFDYLVSSSVFSSCQIL